jgi:hypothetical protein
MAIMSVEPPSHLRQASAVSSPTGAAAGVGTTAAAGAGRSTVNPGEVRACHGRVCAAEALVELREVQAPLPDGAAQQLGCAFAIDVGDPGGAQCTDGMAGGHPPASSARPTSGQPIG